MERSQIENVQKIAKGLQDDYNRSRQRQQKKNKSNGGWWWIVVVMIAVFANVGENGEIQRLFWRFRYWLQHEGERFVPGLFMLVLAIVFIVIVTALVRRKKAEADQPTRSGRTSAAVQRRDPRTKSFTQPDPYCIVCDHTGEDHFRRDKASRIRQLDEWLRNGLIDKEEYKVLKSRYERDL